MNKIETKRKELEEEAKTDLEMGTHDKAWQIEYIASKNMLDGFNLGVEMARKEILDKVLNVVKNHESELWTPNYKRLVKELKQSLDNHSQQEHLSEHQNVTEGVGHNLATADTQTLGTQDDKGQAFESSKSKGVNPSQSQDNLICKKCNDTCDCHMFVGGSGKLCPKCSEDKKE